VPSCITINDENNCMRAEAKKFNDMINKTAKQLSYYYIANVLFLPAALAAKQNSAEKSRFLHFSIAL
jgi:hypothetical protein